MKTYGLNLSLEKQHQSDQDYLFGAFSDPCIADIPEIERESYLPVGEVQRGKEDFGDCASRGPINILETKFNYLYQNNKISPENKKWLEDNEYVVNGKVLFSDAFIAIKSKTTRDGNSMKAPLQAIHDFGLIPKKRMPAEEWMTFDDYHDPKRIESKHEALGENFSKRFPIHYERVFSVHFDELYKEDMLDLAGYAWPIPVNGVYYKTVGDPNHVFMGIRRPRHYIFDNYIDDSDGDFIKKLASDYELLGYGYRIYVAENKARDNFKGSGGALIDSLISWWKTFTGNLVLYMQ